MEALVGPSPSFWGGKRVLLTGHTGFKGAWLSLWLRGLGAKVFGLSLPPAESSLFAAAGLDRLIGGTYGDIRNLDTVATAMREAEPDVVFHLAAQSLVRPSYQSPVETYATNVMGTVHVLAAAQQVDAVQSVVIVTSDKCYDNRETSSAYGEDAPMGGSDPYSSSKGCAELLTAAWRRSFNSPGAARRIGIGSARAGNVVGGGDWAEDRLIPDCMRALSAGQAIGIRNPDSIRPWQHVLDPLCGYLLLAERLSSDPDAYAEAWNFGPADDDAKTVSWLVERVVETWGNGARWHTVPSDGLHEAVTLKLDARKARAKLHWTPRLGLDTTLAWTTDWYRRAFHGEPALELTEEQIRRYGDLNRAEP